MNKLIAWFDARFPLVETWEYHMSRYYAPKNFNFWYFFGSLAIVVLVIQLLTGIFLTMHYKPDANLAYASVEYIMRDVDWGWLIRYMHSTGASFFFVTVYLHMYRGLMYGSYRGPRELLWIIGVIIFIALMAESFMGYLLPWGNMSLWGAKVIIGLFDAIPVVGPGLAEWVRGDFDVSDATLNRFFAFHVAALPLVLILLIFLHLVALHHVGSNNPDGIEIKKNKDANGIPVDGVPFHPYYTLGKDLMGIVGFLIIFSAVVFFAPDMGGLFLEHDNFTPANSLKTPANIVPLWYFTPFYSILRASTTNMMYIMAVVTALVGIISFLNLKSMRARILSLVIALVLSATYFTMTPKVWGVIFMFASLGVMFLLPWLDRSPVKSIRYRGWMTKIALLLFTVSFVSLGWLGMQHVTATYTVLAQISTVVYFLYFALMPFYTTWEKTKPVPERLTK